MNALQLYNLHKLPEPSQKAPGVQKNKKQRIQEPVSNTSRYVCFKCHSKLNLTPDSIVQCSHCDARIVFKITSMKRTIYNAI